MANTPELHFLHYLGWCVCLETLFNCCFSFSPLLFSNFPIYPFKKILCSVCNLEAACFKLLWHLWSSPWRRRWLSPRRASLSAFPEQGNSSSMALLSATNLQQQLFIPISLPSNFPFESCSSWCFSISQLLMIFFPFRFHSSDLRMFCWCSYCRHL